MLALGILLWLWRVHTIALGPDPDGDAYGHFVIARQLLETPLDLHIHWVWLPLYHLLLAAGIGLGGSLDHVRLSNALLSALTPLLLGWGLRRAAMQSGGQHSEGELSGRERAVPLLAAALAVVAPLSSFLGTTAQPEPLFALLLLGAALLLTEQRWAPAALALCALVLLRYEAWAVAASVASLLVLQRCWPRAAPLGGGGAAQPLRRARLACVLAPALTVLGWATLRRLAGGGWFDFLQLNQRFAEDALSRLARPSPLTELRELWDAVPAPGWLLVLLALIGLPRLARRSVWLLVVPLSVAAFLLLGWLLRSHLGLSRHWVGLLPFAAAAIAQGCGQCADWLERAHPRSGGVALSALVLLLGVQAARLLPAPFHAWRQHTAAALPDRREAAAFLRGLPLDTPVWCDDAAAEVLSQLPRERFVRTYLGQDALAQLRRWQATDEIVVLSQAERLRGVLPFAEPLYGDPGGPGLLALRVRPRALPDVHRLFAETQPAAAGAQP